MIFNTLNKMENGENLDVNTMEESTTAIEACISLAGEAVEESKNVFISLSDAISTVG